MQIGFVGQYNKSATQTIGTPVPGSNVSSLTASVKALGIGSIFEGNVTYVKGGNVILSLENGQTVHAKLDHNAPKLEPGQSMFFQVKSNDGGTVSIRPYTGGNMSNPTLVRALDAAGLPVNVRNLDMVNSMMKEQMPIHAEALMDMHRVIVSNEGVKVDTLVQMTKLNMSINPQMAAQFENYQNDTHMLLNQMSDLMEELPEFLQTQSADVPQMIEMNDKLIQILTEDMPKEEVILPQTRDVDGTVQTDQGQNIAPVEIKADSISVADQMSSAPDSIQGMFLSELAGTEEPQTSVFLPNQLGSILEPEQMNDLADALRVIGDISENEAVFDEDGNLNQRLTARQLLDFINGEMVAHKAELENEDVKDVFSHKGYQKLLGHVMEEQWLVQPQDLKTKDKLKELYERLDRQMEQIDKVLKATGNDNSILAKSTGQIRGNVEFMNEVNHIYNYVQIPLKLQGQNANGDLYVYTNKRKAMEKDGELSAFLHLDMEHLGSTDVMVKMKGKAVDTSFSFDDDKSFELVQKYLPILDARLTALGYNCTISVNNEAKKVDFVEDFLKKDLPGGSSGGVVHRYSFDVRA